LHLGRVDGRDAIVDVIKALTDVVPDVTFRILSVEAIDKNASMGRTLFTGTNSEGGSIESESYSVFQVRNGQCVRQEEFSLEDRDAALACFERIARATPDFENDCKRALDRLKTLVENDDWDGVAGILAEDAVIDDRRKGLTWREQGREKTLANLRVANEGVIGATRPVGTRGDRLALVRNVWHLPNGFEVEILQMTEIDDHGLFSLFVIFDPDDLDAAFTELDERYIASRDDPEADPWQVSPKFVRAFNARDWAGLRSLLRDFVYVDHQPAGVGTVEGFDAYVRSVSTLLELVPDLHIAVTEIFGTSDCGAVFRLQEHGTDVNGNAIQFEYASIGVTQDGQITRIENFPIEELDAALARLEELSRDSAPTG
jgi:ketosteroid isomerase-like protein